jgi:hypothetical protein
VRDTAFNGGRGKQQFTGFKVPRQCLLALQAKVRLSDGKALGSEPGESSKKSILL